MSVCLLFVGVTDGEIKTTTKCLLSFLSLATTNQPNVSFGLIGSV